MSRITELESQIIHQTNRLKFFKQSIPELYHNISTIELHNSNHIEGNTLTYNDTIALLNGELVQVEQSQEKDAKEVFGYRDASLVMIEALQQYYTSKQPLTIDFICELHYHLLINVRSDYAGRLRQHLQDGVIIRGAKFDPLEGGSVIAYLEDLLDWYNRTEIAPLEKIAILKTDFIYCHPFFDGNGRVSRLIMNMELMKYGFYPNIIRVEDKKEYCESLENSIICGNHDYFIEFFYEHYLKELEGYERAKFVIKE